ESGWLHPACRQHGFPRRRPGAHAEPEIRFRARFRSDRLHRARARRNRRKEGFPGQGLAGIRGLSEEPRRRRETGAWRHWLVVAHGVPVVHVRGRRAAEPRRLSRHRPGVLIGGHVDFFCEQAVSVAPQIAAGTIKAYGVSSAERLAPLPNVPTAKEAGVNYQMSIWAGIFAPKGTPRD